jgi:hypothetical protein
MAFSAGQVLTAAQLNEFNTYNLEVEPDPAGPAATPAPITFTTHTPLATGVLKYDSGGFFEMSVEGTDRYRFGNAGNNVEGTAGSAKRGFSAYTVGAMDYHRDTTGLAGVATFDFTGGAQEDLWTATGHGLANDQAITFFAGPSNPTEFALNTVYYIGDATTNTFRLYTDTAANSGTLITGSSDSNGDWDWQTEPEEGILALRSDIGGSGTFQHIFYAAGYTGNRLNSYAGISDERVKENIAPYGDPRQDLADMEVINFNLMGEIKDGEVVPYDRPDPIKQVGYSAQALLSIKPGLVAGSEKSGYMVKTTVLIPILHRAWQLDHADLEALEARVAALESA